MEVGTEFFSGSLVFEGVRGVGLDKTLVFRGSDLSKKFIEQNGEEEIVDVFSEVVKALKVYNVVLVGGLDRDLFNPHQCWEHDLLDKWCLKASIPFVWLDPVQYMTERIAEYLGVTVIDKWEGFETAQALAFSKLLLYREAFEISKIAQKIADEEEAYTICPLAVLSCKQIWRTALDRRFAEGFKSVFDFKARLVSDKPIVVLFPLRVNLGKEFSGYLLTKDGPHRFSAKATRDFVEFFQGQRTGEMKLDVWFKDGVKFEVFFDAKFNRIEEHPSIHRRNPTFIPSTQRLRAGLPVGR